MVSNVILRGGDAESMERIVTGATPATLLGTGFGAGSRGSFFSTFPGDFYEPQVREDVVLFFLRAGGQGGWVFENSNFKVFFFAEECSKEDTPYKNQAYDR